MNKIVFLLAALLMSLQSSAQMKLIKKLLSNEKDTTRKASFMPIPVFGYAQETGFEFGIGGIYSYYMDRKDPLNRSSNFFANASYSTLKTYNFSFKGDAWTTGNKNHFISEIRFKNMPFNFYGIGNNTLKKDEDKLVLKQIKLQLEAEQSFLSNAYTGVSLAFENQSFTDKELSGLLQTNPNIHDKDGGSVFYIGVSQSYDTRNSNNYTTKGFYARATYQYAPDFFGGDSFTGSQLKLDVRNFWAITEKVTLGLQGIYYTTQGNNTPFYLFQQMGNDAMMRGYYGGRYRDENLLGAQTELRYRFMNRFGIVAFGGAGKVFANDDANLKDLKPSYGIGGRYFFDTAKGLSVRVDYGIGEKLPGEKRQAGFYISFAEAF